MPAGLGEPADTAAVRLGFPPCRNVLLRSNPRDPRGFTAKLAGAWRAPEAKTSPASASPRLVAHRFPCWRTPTELASLLRCLHHGLTSTVPLAVPLPLQTQILALSRCSTSLATHSQDTSHLPSSTRYAPASADLGLC